MRRLVLVIAVASACSPASNRITLPATENLPRPEAAACTIAAPKATLTVSVTAGSEELTVPVRGARVTVTPREGGTSSVDVDGALAFSGRVSGLELYPSAPVVVASGVAQLGPMSVLREPSVRGSELVARIVDVGADFELSDVSVPCSAVEFVGSGDPSEDMHRGLGLPPLRSYACAEPCVHYTTPESLDFHALPGQGARVRLTGSTIVSELERRGEWTRVSTADFVHLDGAQLMGWVEHSQLTKITGGIGFTGGRGRASPPRSGEGHIASSRTRRARVDVGTPVFAVPSGGTPWATVRDGEAELEIITEPAGDRARITRAPFLPFLTNAWVSLAAVHPLE